MRKVNISQTDYDNIHGKVTLPLSKSILNRMLVISALGGQRPKISDKSLLPRDSRIMIDGITDNTVRVDVEDCGTAARFLTAYYAIKEGETTIIEGTERMHERPIRGLVDALISLGANIEYLKKPGHLPVRIVGRKLEGGEVKMHPRISSQFVSALMMIAPTMPKGLYIRFSKGRILSKQYIEMTGKLMADSGASVDLLADGLFVYPKPYNNDETGDVEYDMTSTAPFHELSLISRKILDYGFYGEYKNMLDIIQEDKWCGPMAFLLINDSDDVTMRNGKINPTYISEIDFSNHPDLAPYFICGCVGAGIPFDFRGLSTLNSKECRRLDVLKEELSKIHANLTILDDGDRMTFNGKRLDAGTVEFNPHGDHRMVMAFAPLALRYDVTIQDPLCVCKSFPEFWQQFAAIGFTSMTFIDDED